MDAREVNLQPSPELDANPISRLFLLWVVPFLRRGAKNDLNLEDVYQHLPEDASARLGDQMEEKWKEEVTRASKQNRRPRLWRVVIRLLWWRYVLIGLGYTFDELVLRTVQPLVLRRFIKTFTVENPEDDPNHQRDQFLYAGGLVFVVFTHGLFQQNMIGAVLHLAIKTRLGLSSLIYRKILRLRKSNSEHTNVGKLCNLLSSDVGRLDQSFHMLQFLYISPLQLILCTYLLWNALGVSCFGGVGCLIIFLPMQTFVGRFFMYFRVRIAQRTDERGRFLNEILGGVRLLKMYAWEKPFSNSISQRRRSEIKYVRKSLYLKGMYVSVYAIATKVITFCALMLYVALGNLLTADKAFFTMAVFNTILQAVMHRFPTATSMLGELIASLDRIEKFMLSEDNARLPEKKRDGDENGKAATVTVDLEPRVIMRNYSASWIQNEKTLENLTVDLRGNKLVLVVGHVGSGKSSLLNAILSELPYTSSKNVGGFELQGSLSYASQEAWIFPATVRQNILFGLEMDEDRYWKVVQLCCLAEDLQQFPDGDMTLVGERGVALSGGQKARVNLARAIYQQAKVYMLDDPLSAVDTKVSKALFQDCILTHLEGKLRILVTHQLQYLPMADHIIVLNRDGQIWGQGTYEELLNSDIDFTTLISKEYMNEDMQDGDELEDRTSSQETNLRQRRPSKTTIAPTIKTRDQDTLTESAVHKKKEERKEVGSIGIGLYYRYFRSGGSLLTIILLFCGFIAAPTLSRVTEYWLSLWTNEITAQSGNSSSLPKAEDKESVTGDQNYYAYVYCYLIGAFIVVSIFRSILFFWYCMRISVNLHDSMFHSLVRAPVKFFDENPSGRVMNRFTKDLNQIDEQLPVAFFDFMTTILGLFGMLALNILANYYLAVPAMLLLGTLWKIRVFFLDTARDLKRLESLAKSPLFTHVTMTVQGLTTIRALHAEKRVLSQFDKIQDTHTAVYYMTYATNRWFAVWLEMLVVIFLAVVSFGFLLITTSAQGGSVGVAISAILSMAGTLQWGIRQSAETENFMTSVERAFEYTNLTPEAPLECPEDEKLPQDWPKEGRLHFQDLSLSYDDAGERKVLDGITFSVNSQEKVGIVGRTGAGKSSLITALFRLTEPCHGNITMDDVVLGNVGLHTLRSRISIIPQDPVLFTGSLRYNLDPFDEFSDEQLWRVIEEVDLHHTVQNIDCPVADGGSNFSVGQRQLVCLARAVLRRNRVVVLDEATANVDPATDYLVQHTIRSKFADCTILTIAHRLQTVLDNDRIIVLDAGRVVEFDKPDVLMADEQSHFYAMLQHQKQSSKPKDK